MPINVEEINLAFLNELRKKFRGCLSINSGAPSQGISGDIRRCRKWSKQGSSSSLDQPLILTLGSEAFILIKVSGLSIQKIETHGILINEIDPFFRHVEAS